MNIRTLIINTCFVDDVTETINLSYLPETGIKHETLPNVGLMLSIIYDAAPTLNQHRVSVSCLLEGQPFSSMHYYSIPKYLS